MDIIVVKHFITKNDSLKRPLPVTSGSGKTSSNRDSKSCHADDVTENNVAAEFDVEPAQALEAQREILTHEAAEDIHRRDGISLSMMRTLEFQSHSEPAAHREGFEQNRNYLQKCHNSSNEECRKYYLFEELHNERASLVPDVRRRHARERQMTSEVSEAQYQETEYKGRRQNVESHLKTRFGVYPIGQRFKLPLEQRMY